MPQRVIIFADLDYFFAQCEELRNPSLKSKPVVVCVYSGRSEDSGAVSTANYIARRYGVTSGIPIFLAKKRLEGTEAVFLPVDDVFYETVSRSIMGILRGHAESFEQVGIDEAYLEVTRKAEGDFDKATALAHKLKEEVKAQQGIIFSIGLGPNKLLAKIAADYQKPDGLTVVRPKQVQSFLSLLPVGRLLGVGRKTEEKMKELGIGTVSDLANFDIQRLIEVFGKKWGVYFHNAANGIDNEPVQERSETGSISRISTLKIDTRDLAIVLEKINQLCEEIYVELARRRLGFKQVGAIAVMKDMSVRSRSATLEDLTSDLEQFKGTVKELFKKLLMECNLEIRRVGVRVAALAKEEKQKPLMSFMGTDYQNNNRSGN